MRRKLPPEAVFIGNSRLARASQGESVHGQMTIPPNPARKVEANVEPSAPAGDAGNCPCCPLWALRQIIKPPPRGIGGGSISSKVTMSASYASFVG